MAAQKKEPLSQLDRLLSARVFDLAGDSIENQLDGNMFKAGRCHYLAESITNEIEDDDMRAHCQQLVTQAFNMACELDRLWGHAVLVDRLRLKLIDLFLASEAWCEARGQTAVQKIEARKAKIMLREKGRS